MDDILLGMARASKAGIRRRCGMSGDQLAVRFDPIGVTLGIRQ